MDCNSGIGTEFDTGSAVVPAVFMRVWLGTCAAHQSLQEYLLARLIAEASVPTLDEVLDRADGRAGGVLPLAQAVADLKEDRARR